MQGAKLGARETSPGQGPCSPGGYQNTVYLKKISWTNWTISTLSSLHVRAQVLFSTGPTRALPSCCWWHRWPLKPPCRHGWYPLCRVGKALELVQSSPSWVPWSDLECEWLKWHGVKQSQRQSLCCRITYRTAAWGDLGRERRLSEGYTVPGSWMLWTYW